MNLKNSFSVRALQFGRAETSRLVEAILGPDA
jgi:hypothetical protein